MRTLTISLLFIAALALSSLVNSGEPQFVLDNDTLQSGNISYSQCEPGQSSQPLSPTQNNYLDPENIRLLNWNIYKGNNDNWAEDLLEFIEERDIVTIQEAHLSDQLESVLARQKYQWILNVAFELYNRPSGVMTASRVPALDSCGMRHMEPLTRAHKTTLVSFYPIEGTEDTLLVANIHGINFTLGTKAYRRQIEHLFNMVRSHEGPVVIAGDFNTWSRARLEIVQEQVATAGLDSLDYTAHVRTRIFGNALDHVFFRGLELLAHHSWPVDSSDHNPTRAHFRLL
jgi:endonuclease/exonuclease/phosphatase (EEP) superfamily protein YafD